MQRIELQNTRPPQIRSYIKEANPAEKIAGLFYYSSAAILWAAAVAFLLGLLSAPDWILGMLFLSLIYGLPGWVWAGIGVFLFCCHMEYYKFGMRKDHAVWMWLLTAGFNAIQAVFIFNLLDSFALRNAIGGWNLIAASLSLFAFYFEMRKA